MQQGNLAVFETLFLPLMCCDKHFTLETNYLEAQCCLWSSPSCSQIVRERNPDLTTRADFGIGKKENTTECIKK